MFHPRPLHGVSTSLSVRPSPERSPPKLCENGRGYITDPSTGQPVCLCHLESPSPSPHGMQGHPALRGLRSLPSPRPGLGDVHGFHAQLSAMSPLGETNGLLPPHIAFHPYGMYAGLDVNGGPMRKAATRETTGPLKAWLSEHKKNPYPTKAEKIMLAIITRMTLTQVSTWFANARRRLKKDNRLTPGEGEGEDDSVGIDSDREGDSDSVSVDVSVSVDRDVKTALRADVKLSSEGEVDPDSFSDISDEENDHVFRSRPSQQTQQSSRVPVITSSASYSHHHPEAILKVPENSEKSSSLQQSCPEVTSAVEKPKVKPKIWSISHILDS